MRLFAATATTLLLSLPATHALADDTPVPAVTAPPAAAAPPAPSTTTPPPALPLAPMPAQTAPPPYAFPPGGFRVEPLPEYDTREKQKSNWYGWQSMIGVIPAHLSGILALTSRRYDDLFGTIAVLGHVATTPIVHWVHGNVGRGFLSLGLNVTLPYLGLLSVYALSETIGFPMAIIGIAGWPALDMALLHYEDPTPKKKTATSLIDVNSISVMPIIDKERRGLAFGARF